MDNNPQKDSLFFEILRRNNKDEIMDFLISKGKKPKVISPIIFKKEEEIHN